MTSRNFKRGNLTSRGARKKTDPVTFPTKSRNNSSHITQEELFRSSFASEEADYYKKHALGTHHHMDQGDYYKMKRDKDYHSFPLSYERSQNDVFLHNDQKHTFQQQGNYYQAEKFEVKTNLTNKPFLAYNTRGNYHIMGNFGNNKGITSQKNDFGFQRDVNEIYSNKHDDYHNKFISQTYLDQQNSKSVFSSQALYETHKKKVSFSKCVSQNRLEIYPKVDKEINYQSKKYNSQDFHKLGNMKPDFSNKELQMLDTKPLNKFENKKYFPNKHLDTAHCSQIMGSSHDRSSSPSLATERNIKQRKKPKKKYCAKNNIWRKQHNARKIEQQSCLLSFSRTGNNEKKSDCSSETGETDDSDNDTSTASVISSVDSNQEKNDLDCEVVHSDSDFVTMNSESSSNESELSKEQYLKKGSLVEIDFKQKTKSLISKTEESYIAVYWDIENCTIPRQKSAVDFVKMVRDTFYHGQIEVDFIVACDTRFMSRIIEKELTESVVTVVHADSENKNAADKKLQTFLNRFAHQYGQKNSSIVLVSGDSDFAPDLNEMRYRHHININLIYNSMARKALQAAAHRSILFEDFVKDLPDRSEDEIEQPYLIVSNFPKHFASKEIKNFLSDLIRSINGRVCNISNNMAEISFSNKCAADKAFKKLQGICVSDSKINVTYKLKKYETEFSNSNNKHGIHLENSADHIPDKNNTMKKIILDSGKTADVEHLSRTLTLQPGKYASLYVCINTRLEDKEYWQLYFRQLWHNEGISAENLGSGGMYCVKFESLSKAQKAKKILQKQQEIDPSAPKLLKLMKGDNVLDNDLKNVIPQQKELKMKKVYEYLNIIETKRDRCLKNYEQKLSFVVKEAQLLENSVGIKAEVNHEQRQSVQHKLDELKEQKAVFCDFTNKLCQKFMKLKQSYTDDSYAIFEDLVRDYGRECSSFMSGLPIYGKKNAIIQTVQKNQVVILRAETGSGKSTQITQYLWREGFASDGLIICTQPRKIAAISIAKHVSSQLGCSVGNTVGYQIGLNAKRSKSTQIMYVTDFALLKLCVTNPDFKDISCIIIDEAHERSIYTDLLLGIIKKCLPKRPSLKVIITSATINVSIFLKYFQLKEDALLQISGRTFPIEDIWYDHDVKLGWNYLEKTVNIAYDIFKQEQPGDILAFLVTPAETEKAVESFQAIFKSDKCKSKVITHCLHGKLDVQEQQKVFEKTPDDTRKVVFSTNCAETSVTIPGIKYVVDCGMVKEAKFDISRNINVLSIDFVNRSSAEQRRGRAGRTQCGKCFRLYSKVNYNKDMAEDMTPEILRVNLGQTILKLMELGIPNPMQFDFVQSPSLESLVIAMKQLVHLGAVNEINTTLTEIGKKMSKLPLEPRLSYLVIQGIGEEVGYEAVIIAALATVSRNIFFRNEDNKKEADAKKMRFCHAESDFFTYFEIYKEWSEVPKAGKSRWCVLNCVNARSMRVAHDLINELILTLSKELNINLKAKYSADETSEVKIHEIIFRSFSENLCIFSGHHKVGYLSPLITGELHIHPSSSLCYLGMYNPQFIVYDTILETSQTFLVNITPVSEEIIQKAIAIGALRVNLDSLKSLTLNAYRISPVGEGVIKRDIIGKGGSKLQAIHQKIKEHTNNTLSAIDINTDKGEISVFLSTCYREVVEKIICPIIIESQKKFYQEEQEIFGISGIPVLGAVMGIGADIKEILMPGEYRDVEVKINGSISLEEVKGELYKCGDIHIIKERHDRCIKVTFNKVSSARYAVTMFQNSKEFKVRGMAKFSSNSDGTPFFKVAINWIRRPCTGLAFISFQSSADFVEASSILSSQYVNFEGNILKIGVSKTSPDELCIRNLPKTSDNKTLGNFIETFLPNDIKLKKNIVVRTKPFESSADEIENFKKQLSQLLLNYTSASQFYIDFITPAPHETLYRAFVYFENPRDGQIAVNALKGHACIKGELLGIKPLLRIQSYCSLKAFTAVKEQIDDALAFFNKNSYENDSLSIKANVKKADTVIVTILSNNLGDMIAAHEVFQGILKGEQIKCSGNYLLEKLFLDSSKLFFKELEKTIPEACIHLNRYSKVISIFGTRTSCSIILNEINAFLDKVSKENFKEISFVSERYPKGFLKYLIKKYGYDLEQLRVLTNLKSIEINTRKHLITLRGSEEDINQCQSVIDSVSEDLGMNAEIVADEDCPVCLAPLDQKHYRLEYCGHAYCRDCIIMQLKNVNFPILCCKENCSKPFVVADIKWVIKEDKSICNNLYTSSLKDFVVKNEEIKHCPAPDCSMVYRVTDHQNKFDCPSCQNSICTRCCVVYHYGMSCEIYQCSKSDDDYSLKVWLKADQANRKLCPSCSSPIEKNGGCNHMTCWKCKCHMCWLCETEFPSEMRVYAHQPFCPNNQ